MNRGLARLPKGTLVETATDAVREHIRANRLKVGEPLGIDMTDMLTVEALRRAGVEVTDGSQGVLEARKLKTPGALVEIRAIAVVDK